MAKKKKSTSKKPLSVKGFKVNKNCNAFFVETEDKGLVVQIETFNCENFVNLTEKTFKAIQDTYYQYKREVKGANSAAS